MVRKCDKCKKSVADDDFLCPHCGTIWDDLDDVLPEASEPELPAPEPQAEAAPEPQPEETKKQPKWLLPLAIAGIVLLFALVWFLTDPSLWAGEGTTGPSTSTPAATLPTGTYQVIFTDTCGCGGWSGAGFVCCLYAGLFDSVGY